MGLLSKLFGIDREMRTRVVLAESGIADGDLDLDRLVEIDVVGESHRQEALARIAGPKGPDGKNVRVGVTLRREPANPADPSAVRVEALGLHVGYLPRDLAARVSPRLAELRGAVEGHGLIVGGWKDRDSEGHYGIRVWLDPDTAARVGIRRPLVEARIVVEAPAVPQSPAPGPTEVRIGPSSGDTTDRVNVLTVTCEEHYQDTLANTQPPARPAAWPIVVAFDVVDRNPHLKKGVGECVRVSTGGRPVGFLTAKMSERHRPAIYDAMLDGKTATAIAMVRRGEKGGQQIWRVAPMVWAVAP